MATRVEAPPAPARRTPSPPPPPAPEDRARPASEGLLLASLAATVCLLALPGATVALLLRVAGVAPPVLAGWALTAVVSLSYMFLGSKLWARHPRSASLGFGELVLWSWARRRRAEGTLRRGEDLLDDEIGELLNPQGRREQVKVLRELNAALEVRDPYTRGHARRVERHAHRIALALRCDDDDIFDIRLAASLHDVGKIKVPDRILRKDGPLDADEWRVMKQHSAVGAELLERLGNRNVVAAVRSHHERWDGRGYPDGLQGTQIPLGARIIAVADTFDAITSCRPYRSRSDRAHAIAVLKSEAGKQFDPAVVTAFLSTTPHQAAAFAGLAALAAPMARKLASQWGVVFNKVGAVSLAGTMTASAFTGAATLERATKPVREREAKVRAAERAEQHANAAAAEGDATGAHGASSSPEGAPDPRGKALGHSKKAHEGGNGKSQAGGRGKAVGHSENAGGAAGGKALGHSKKAHKGGNGKSNAGGNTPEGKGKAAPGAPFDSPAAAGASSGKPPKAEDAAPEPTAPDVPPAPEPAPPEPQKPAKPAKPEPPAPAPEQPAPEAAPAPEAPPPAKDKGSGKTK